MNFTIRPARLADAGGIARVHVESWKTTYRGIVPETYLASLDAEQRAEQWKEWLIAGTSLILVAEDATGVFAFAAGGKLREAIDTFDAELYAIYLLDRQHKKGVGRALAGRLAQALRANGFRSMVVWVLERNRAVGFYQRLGGSRVAQKEIEIGGVRLIEVAFGWAYIDELL